MEAVAYTIWITMGEVARLSQEITKATGNAIRSDAARIEKNQSVAKLLQAYMDVASIQKHVESWRQILMFFVRTQAPHDCTVYGAAHRCTVRSQQRRDRELFTWRTARVEFFGR